MDTREFQYRYTEPACNPFVLSDKHILAQSVHILGYPWCGNTLKGLMATEHCLRIILMMGYLKPHIQSSSNYNSIEFGLKS